MLKCIINGKASIVYILIYQLNTLSRTLYIMISVDYTTVRCKLFLFSPIF